MNIKIQDINFSIKDDLKAFVEKKVGKLSRFYSEIIDATVVLTLTKPETNDNKKVRVTLSVPGPDLFSEKTAGSFEEALDEVCAALESQLERLKGKHKK